VFLEEGVWMGTEMHAGIILLKCPRNLNSFWHSGRIKCIRIMEYWNDLDLVIGQS
jgi:hypothetical protein